MHIKISILLLNKKTHNNSLAFQNKSNLNKFKQNQSNLWGNRTQVLKNSAQFQHPSQPHNIKHHQPSIFEKNYVLQL
jgi:hypothetical protein